MSTLRETLEAAARGDDAPAVVEATSAPTPAAETTPPTPEPAPDAAPAGTAEVQAGGGSNRDEHGRFKPKTEPAASEGANAQPPAETPSETAKPAGEGPQSEATRVPPSLPAAVKAKFSSLDPDVQKAFVALEETVQTSKAEWGKKGQRLNRYDEILQPHIDRWRLNGLDEFSGIQTLLAAQAVLDRNPLQGLVEIGRSYGVTPAHLAQAFGLTQGNGQQPRAEGPGAPTGAPDISAVLQQHLAPLQQGFQTLQQQFAQSRQQSEAAQLAAAQREIESFASDPANMYFDNVSDAVARYLAEKSSQGPIVNTRAALQEAYERAIWADPDIRPLLIQTQAQAEASRATAAAEDARKAAEKAQREKAQAANHAGGSVTGSPSPGATAPAGAQGSLRDQLAAAYREHSGAV
jgi:hypothetical protein